jgi:hypothetical protein
VTLTNENHGHKWARLYRRVRASRMTSPHVTAEYDRGRNIVYINQDRWEELSGLQQRQLLKPSAFE